MPHMPRIVLLSLALVLVATAVPAAADDEASEHTAKLVGDTADTLGVAVKFDDQAGWSMTVRARPGAKERTVALAPLGTGHRHVTVYVAPKRARITIVETYIGLDAKRLQLAASDPFAWTWSPDGKLLRTVTYGQAFSAAERAKFQRSISHLSWLEGMKVTKAGLELAVAGSSRTIVVDANTGAVR